MSDDFLIVGKKVILAEIRERDIELIRLWRNEPLNRKCFFYQKFISKEQQKIWFNKYRNNFNDLIFLIKNKVGKKIGIISIYNIDLNKKTSEIGRILIRKDERGKDYSKEAINLLLNYIFFKNFFLRIVFLEVFKENIRAVELYKKLGFKIILEKKKKIIQEDKVFYKDIYLMCICREYFDKSSSKF